MHAGKSVACTAMQLWAANAGTLGLSESSSAKLIPPNATKVPSSWSSNSSHAPVHTKVAGLKSLHQHHYSTRPTLKAADGKACSELSLSPGNYQSHWHKHMQCPMHISILAHCTEATCGTNILMQFVGHLLGVACRRDCCAGLQSWIARAKEVTHKCHSIRRVLDLGMPNVCRHGFMLTSAERHSHASISRASLQSLASRVSPGLHPWRLL